MVRRALETMLVYPSSNSFQASATHSSTVKDVHKDPALELVGWWSTASPSGPDASHLPIHNQLLQDYNESAVFLAFHTSQLERSESHKGKLPLTIYESVLESDNAGHAAKEMQIDGEEPALNIRFRALPYSVETGEAEMIGMDTIAKDSGTASWKEPVAPNTSADKGEAEATSRATLSQEEEECMYAPRAALGYSVANFHRSDIQPQHPSQRHQNPPIPHLPHKILRHQRLRLWRHSCKGRDLPSPVTSSPSRGKRPPRPSFHPFARPAKQLRHRGALPKQRRPPRVAPKPSRRERQGHARAGP